MSLQPPDCGDNSCHFAESRGGMRTNGGCRCGDERKQGPGSLSWYARQLKAENAKLRHALEQIMCAASGDDQTGTEACIEQWATEALKSCDDVNASKKG